MYYAIIFVLSLSLFGCFHGVVNGAQKLLAPSDHDGAYLGAYANFGPNADQVTVEAINSYRQITASNVVWAYFANNWDQGIHFPLDNVTICQQQGVIPYLRLMPWSKIAGAARRPDPLYSFDEFLAGKFDTQLTAWAQQAAAFGHPMMLEFGPEVNGDWFPWNGRWHGAGKTDGYGDRHYPDGPERFRDVYRHIIKLFRAAGADNITWVFHVDTASSPHRRWNQMHYYYPGDEYIDWIGISVFGAQLPGHQWQMFSHKLQQALPALEKISGHRPWLVAEMGVIEDPLIPQRKAQWLQDAYDSVSNRQFPRIKGISYWHSPGWLANGQASFLLHSSPITQGKIRELFADPFWHTPAILQ